MGLDVSIATFFGPIRGACSEMVATISRSSARSGVDSLVVRSQNVSRPGLKAGSLIHASIVCIRSACVSTPLITTSKRLASRSMR